MLFRPIYVYIYEYVYVYIYIYIYIYIVFLDRTINETGNLLQYFMIRLQYFDPRVFG